MNEEMITAANTTKDKINLALVILSGEYLYKDIDNFLKLAGLELQNEKITYRSRKRRLAIWAIAFMSDYLLPEKQENNGIETQVA